VTAGAGGLSGALRGLRARYGKPIGATLVILALVAGGELYARWHAATRVAPAVLSRAREHGRVDVIVRLGFRPELFHTVFFQKLGRLSGVRGQEVLLRDVAPAGVWRLGRQYWIQAVDLLPPGG
jgi:hypothetical protein